MSADVDNLDMVEVRPTMSKTDALLACAWRWGRKAPRDPGGEPARFGTACHEVYAAIASSSLDGKELRAACVAAADRQKVDWKEVYGLVTASWPAFEKWMSRGNPWKKDFLDAGMLKLEYSVAYDVLKGKARECESPDEATHEYRDCDFNELPGTADIVMWRRNEYLVVLDYKTGADVPEPSQSGQMKSLALALSLMYKAPLVIVGLMHAPRSAGGLPSVYADTLTEKDLRAHRAALKDAWLRRGTSMTPGQYCQYCPCLTTCPTQSSMLVELKRGSQGLALTPERVGAIHMALAQYDALKEQLQAQLKSWVVKNGPAPRPDGKLLDIVERQYETLSKSSVTKALGEVEGAKELERLRKKGCLVTSTREELRAEAEKMR
jgi:hypothetical protein